MEKFKMKENMLNHFRERLTDEEKSVGTIEKYLRDVNYFYSTLPSEKLVTKKIVVEYKSKLIEKYKVDTANSMLVALNRFFVFAGREELRVKSFKRQRQIFSLKEKELSKREYISLLDAARKSGNKRICLIMQTICATGIRVSELSYITSEAVKVGQAEVTCKGKQRRIYINGKLKKLLIEYMKSNEIKSGYIFKTRNGNPMNRSNIWQEMKKLCKSAGVDSKKVFPHNLRHLFARTFYGIEKDIAKLADLLGHSSIETTRIYIMESGEGHKRKIEMMGLV